MIDRNFVVKKILEMTVKKELVWEPILEDFVITDFGDIRLCIKVNRHKIPVHLCISVGKGETYHLYHELLGEILDRALMGINNKIGKPEVLEILYDRIVERENFDPTLTRIDDKVLDEYY